MQPLLLFCRLLVRSSLLLSTLAAAVPPSRAAEPHAPIDLGTNNVESTGINYASAAVTFRDGTIESFFRRSADGHVSIFRMRSTDNGQSWSTAEAMVHLPTGPWGGPIPLLDRDEELHFVIPLVRGAGRKPAVDRFIDLYHLRSTDGRTKWTEPQRIFAGYCGAIQCLVQLQSGRILAPFADWLPNVPTTPPSGPSVTTVVYSDDAGQTWQRSSAALTAPCHDGYNGANYGACEPTLLELADGRVWTLLRTQTGVLYESFSTDGAEWSVATPSRFVSSNSPAFPIRLRDGRIVLFWNNCQTPPRVGEAGVYGGRDALHAAISSDEGKSWRGFREVYRDPTRNGSPPKTGDRGTAYPHATLTADDRILLVSGQGTERRRRFLIDPDWLLESQATASFADLEEWHVFQGAGPVQRWWRDRVSSAELIPHPDLVGANVLHLRRADGLAADGASWNFPAGQSGKLKLRLRLEPNFGGATIGLTDRFCDPCDDLARSQYSLLISPTRQLGENRLQVGTWYEVEFIWTREGNCNVLLDGRPTAIPSMDLPPSGNGLSYLRLRALAQSATDGGLLIDSVSLTVD